MNKEITEKTKKLLFGKSGNLCALCFDNGKKTLLVDADNVMNVNIAHICSREAKDVRYDPNYKQVNDEENLLLLCLKCHREIDKDHPDNYSIDFLRQLKKRHEEYFTKKSSDISNVYDVTEDNTINAKRPQNLKNVWNGIVEKVYNENIGGALEDYNQLIDSMSVLPANCRVLLRICIERGEEANYSSYKVPVSEIEQVMSCTNKQIKDLYDICQKYGFMDYEKEEGVDFFYVTTTLKNSTPIFLELKKFAKDRKISLIKFFDELDFSILDK